MCSISIVCTLVLLIRCTHKADGYPARKYNMGTVLGSILDPAADKALMTTLVVTLTVQGSVGTWKGESTPYP